MVQSRFAVTLALLLAASAAFAQPAGAMGGMATRSVSHFLERERALSDALDRRDRAAAVTLLSDAFLARSASRIDALDSDHWWAEETTRRVRERFVRELAVQESGDIAIVSFLVDESAGRRTETRFVVDIWQSNRLLSRQSARAVGVPAPTRRPSGRE